MEQPSANKPSQSIPRYLIVIFIAILALTGFGIGQQLYKPELKPAVLGAATAGDSEISVNNIPTIKDGSLDPKVRAKYAILLDASSKYMMYGLRAHDRVPIASITKVMTSIVVQANKNLDEVVTVQPEDVDVIGSKVGLRAGDKLKISELLRGMLMKSGNDTAKVLARATGGTEENFVKMMNDKVAELGLKDTQYKDPHGLSSEAYSTPFDQAIIYSYALSIDTLREIMSTDHAIITTEDEKEFDLENSNRLITEQLNYDGAIAGKTGFTLEAGHSLVTAAQRDGHMLISVVLHTTYDTNDASARETARLLDWGFNNFEWN